MKRLLPLLALVLIPVPATAHADGCPPLDCGTTSVAPAGLDARLRPSERTAGAALGLRPPDRAASASSLPSGILSADGRDVRLRRSGRKRADDASFATTRERVTARPLRSAAGALEPRRASPRTAAASRASSSAKHARATVLTLTIPAVEHVRLPGNVRARVPLAGRAASLPHPLAIATAATTSSSYDRATQAPRARPGSPSPTRR